MALFVGEEVTIVSTAQDPVHSLANLDGCTAVCDFFAPGKDPVNVPADRTHVDEGPLVLTWDPTAVLKTTVGAYVGTILTTDWEPGRWTYRVTLSGDADAIEYGSFTLKA